MSSSLIQATLTAGEHLREAIETEDFEYAATLAAARGVLVDRLLTETTPAMHTAAEKEALLAQHRTLTALFSTHEESIRGMLATFSQQRQAHASYHSSPARPSILRQVHG
ncbi:MAG: hypothetical protein HKN04_12545 [Rhodothermaceae bacterium]|nr:hypothetical protein [Rhodothermaceae bacterium]